ncbi:nitric oxide reductase activation protein NorD [Allorhizobium pseudoryzae]|uniref:nitric oxide reductase activation protein NorD n=1 Tax=Allorhizobium pseudoryzae TaxID=379684 RepID=UPI003CFEA0A8
MFEFLEMEETVGKVWHRLVGATSSMPRYPDSAVSFEEVKPILATCFRGFGGDTTAQLGPAHARTSSHRLRLRQLVGLGEEKMALALRDAGTVMLPPTIDLFPDRLLNRSLYIWLAAYMAQMTLSPSRSPDPMRADLEALDRASRTVRQVLGCFPGLFRTYAALSAAVLLERKRGHLPAVEQLVENRVISILRDAAGIANPLPVAIFPQHAPAGYQRMMAVPLWPCFEPREEASGALSDEEAEERSNAAAAGQGQYRADRDAARSTSERSPFILNRFEKILAMVEKINIDRPTDDRQEDDKDAARDLDEITLGKRLERPSSRFRFDLDLPPERVDPRQIEAEITYPEWDYRKAEYRPSYCKVVTAMAASETVAGEPAGDLAQMVRKVCRQFEILRPKNETLKAQLDGAELDLDAVVRMRTDLAAGGEGSERIHLLSRPQGHDLAVTILADVSLSTDAWFDDHRVLDVEKQAIAVLAHGLSACGTNHSILTFTSRRRSWVRVETVKAFGEAMSPAVERRIASLKPGYYTRIGAAIRHASAELCKQPNRRRLLLILTDGKPNDIDHYEGRFALEDSRKAIAEARRQGTSVFAVTVDKDARSYLPAMFGRNGFAIVGNIGRLPQVLPAIYRGLTR